MWWVDLKPVWLWPLRGLTTDLHSGLAMVPTNKLTPWSRVIPEKQTGPQLVKKFPGFYGSRGFITAFTRAQHVFLSWARSIVHVPHSNCWTSFLILSSHLSLGLSSDLFPSGFPTKTLYIPLHHTCYMPHPSHSRFHHPNNIWWGVQIIKLLVM